MNLRARKVYWAKEILKYMNEHGYAAKGYTPDKPFVIALQEMADGKDTFYSKEMDWYIHHYDIALDDELMSLFLKLSDIDFYIRHLKWIPWL